MLKCDNYGKQDGPVHEHRGGARNRKWKPKGLVAVVASLVAFLGASLAQAQCWCPSPQPVVYAAPMASYVPTYYQPAVVIYHQPAPVVYHAAPILPQPASIPVIPALPSSKARLPVVPIRNLYPPGTTYVR